MTKKSKISPKRNTQSNSNKIYVFIDSQNLNLAILSQGWKLDFERFYIYLQDKYKIAKAFLFIGYVPGNESLYTFLQKVGYIVIFKPVLEYKKSGRRIIKGNVDAELVLHVMIEFSNYKKAVIVSGDGDYHCLIEYLIKQSKLKCVMIPNYFKFSALLRKFSGYLTFMNNLKNKLEYKKRRH